MGDNVATRRIMSVVVEQSSNAVESTKPPYEWWKKLKSRITCILTHVLTYYLGMWLLILVHRSASNYSQWWQSAFSLFTTCFIVATIGFYEMAVLSKAGPVHLSSDEDCGTVIEEGQSTPWCAACDAAKPPRAHHCSTCGECVMGLDHHCTFLNNCIGSRSTPNPVHAMQPRPAPIGPCHHGHSLQGWQHEALRCVPAQRRPRHRGLPCAGALTGASRGTLLMTYPAC